MWDGSRAVAGMPANPCGVRQADHHQVGRGACASGERTPDAGVHRRGLKPQTQLEATRKHGPHAEWAVVANHSREVAGR